MEYNEQLINEETVIEAIQNNSLFSNKTTGLLATMATVIVADIAVCVVRDKIVKPLSKKIRVKRAEKKYKGSDLEISVKQFIEAMKPNVSEE